MGERVLNTGTHPIDLSDGRVLAVGETADDIDTEDEHNRSIIDAGTLLVVSSTSSPAPKSKGTTDTEETK